MARFKHYDYNQLTMVLISYLEQLQLGTFELDQNKLSALCAS